MLLKVDLTAVKESEYDMITMIIVANTPDYSKMKVTACRMASHSDELLKLVS